MLAAFLASPLSKLDGTVLGIEEELRAPIVPDCPDILGRVDLILLGNQDLRIVDLKTSRSRWNEAKVQESIPQLALYADLVQPLAQAYGDLPIQLEWLVLTKTQSPAVEKHTVDLDSRQVARIKSVVRRVWKSIVAGSFYPASSAASCSTCPFWTPCQNWEG